MGNFHWGILETGEQKMGSKWGKWKSGEAKWGISGEFKKLGSKKWGVNGENEKVGKQNGEFSQGFNMNESIFKLIQIYC